MTHRAARSLVAILAFSAGAAAFTAQAPLDHVRLNVMTTEYRQAVRLYRAGNASEALEIIGQRPAKDWRQVVVMLMRGLRRQSATKEPLHLFDPSPLNNDLAHNTTLARSAAALHMERALRVLAPTSTEADGHIAFAREIFGFLTTQDGRPSASRGWELALGLVLAADGHFGWAARLLDDACVRFPDDGALQLARGSVHETIASMPASHLATGSVTIAGEFTVWRNPLTAGRAARDDHRQAAREALERAVASLPQPAEARIRLARIRLLQGEPDAASQLLTEVIERHTTLTPREAYLARLFLARVRQKHGRLAEAARLLEEAIGLVPSGQSAFVELADVARAQDGADAGALIVERMLAAPRADEDPWAGYRFAQYWLRDDLLARLREEARR